MKYWAFISYSHRDTAIADWLHKKLETYRVPRGLVGTPSREGEVPARIFPIFRDRDELPTSAKLGENLERCLQQSRYLVVICSPASAQSHWVEEEVRAFKGWHGRDRVIALISGGVPNASDGAHPEQECFPHSMRFDEVKGSTPVRTEPIAADIRPEGDGRQRALLKIVAGLLGLGFDDLYQREKRREKQRKILAGAVAGIVLLVLVVTFGWILRIGKSQKEIRRDLVDVREDAAVATTEFQKVRPKSKEAENRIRAAADHAAQVLDALEEARKTNKPNDEYRVAYEDAVKAIVDVNREAKSADESIFASELAKPLNARLLMEGTEFGKEMTRRAEAKVQEAEALGQEQYDRIKRQNEEKERERARRAGEKPED